MFWNIETDDGSLLENKMYDAEKSGASAIEDVCAYINNNNIKIKKSGFLSTCLDEKSRNETIGRNVLWKLKVPSGIKGVYVDILNIDSNRTAAENEVLLQSGLNISIIDAKYDYSNQKWLLTGEVSK